MKKIIEYKYICKMNVSYLMCQENIIYVKGRPIDFYHDKSMTKNSIDFIIHDNTTITIKGEKLKHRKFRTK
jgi:hypothetical protein